ncbi:MAG: hypothetical protein C4320_07725 [Armatimonadota bacterium]
MAALSEVWSQALPKVREGVTGVGVWSALNQAVPITIEDGVFVLGSPAGQSELTGHLRIAATHRLLEQHLSAVMGQPIRVRVIEGTTPDAWEMAKRRDVEKRRMQDAEMAKMRLELTAKSSWETVYESLSRRYAAIQNKSLPQNRARFFDEACAIVAEARKDQTNYDELAERNFARCLERVAQYCDIPSPLVAMEVLKRSGEM